MYCKRQAAAVGRRMHGKSTHMVHLPFLLQQPTLEAKCVGHAAHKKVEARAGEGGHAGRQLLLVLRAGRTAGTARSQDVPQAPAFPWR